MRRLIVAALAFGAAGGIGCAGSATLVHKAPDGTAVIALKANGDMADAQKLAAKELGGEVEIVGTTQPSLQPGAAPTDQTVMHYVYKRKGTTNVTGLPPAPGGGMPGGVRQAGFTGQPGTGGGMSPAGGNAAGVPGSGSGFGTFNGGGMQPPAMFPNSK